MEKKTEKEDKLLLRIYKAVLNDKINFEKVMMKKSYYGSMCNILPLFCSYGQIGYVVSTQHGKVICDLDLNKIKIETFK